MSRGPGKWQRLILAALEHYPAFYLRDLLGKDCKRSDYVALNRAMLQLLRAGTIDGRIYSFCTPRSAVYRFGVEPYRHALDELHESLKGKGLSVDGLIIAPNSQDLDLDHTLITRLERTPEEAAAQEQKEHSEWVDSMAQCFMGLAECAQKKAHPD